MHAAVVTSFDTAPDAQDFTLPTPQGAHQVVVDVLAAGLHPRVRSQADGTHYTSTHELPLVPGIDGVGRDASGALRYFVLPDTTLGSMAEQTIIDTRRSITLDEGCDPVQIAAAMNPAMSSWVALRRRTRLTPGQKVLILGATGNAGRLAVQVARHLGASNVAAVGRDTGKLAELTDLGADHLIDLSADPAEVSSRLAEAGRHVDVVLDYLWGEPTATALRAIVPTRRDDDQQLNWIQIGSVAGTTCPLPSAALRATRLQIVGSGQGSVSNSAILAELPDLAERISAGTFAIDAHAVALDDVEAAWVQAATSRQRIVITPR